MDNPSQSAVAIDNDDIESTVPSRISAMPDGLLNELSLTEISDLFSYLGVLPASSSIAEKPTATKR